MDVGPPSCLWQPWGSVGPPRLALLTPVRGWDSPPLRTPVDTIPAALQWGGQGAGKCEKEKFLRQQEVTVSLSSVHGKARALPTVKKLWSYLF